MSVMVYGHSGLNHAKMRAWITPSEGCRYVNPDKLA